MNEKINVLIQDLHLDPEKNQPSYACQNFKIFPDGKEIHGGFLFGIIEIKATPAEESNRIIKTIINTLTEDYYQQIITSPDPQKINIETIFEYSLNKTNQKITELIQIGQLNLVKENLSYFLGVIRTSKDNRSFDLFFSHQGQIKAYLLHKSPKQTFHIIDVIMPDEKQTQENGKIKIFSSITSGQISLPDTFIVCTEIFSNYISPNKIKHVLLNNAATDAIDYFKTLIRNIGQRPTMAYSLLLVGKKPNNDHENATRSASSINKLIENTSQTEKLLTPNFSFNLKNKLKNLLKKNRNYQPRKTPPEDKGQPDQTTSQTFGNPFKRFFKNIFLLITGHKNISNTTKEQKNKLFKNPKIRILIIFIIIIAVLGLIAGILWTQKNAKIKQTQDEYAQQINNVKSLIDDAESSLIYKNRPQSLEKLEKAKTELDYLPQATEEQLANYNTLEQQIKELNDQIFNIEKIVPKQLLELSYEEKTFNYDKLLFVNNKLIAYGTDIGLAQISLTDNKIEKVLSSDSTIVKTATENNKLYFVTNDDNLNILDNNIIATTSFSVGLTTNEIAIYNERLYELNNQAPFITKYNKTATGFGSDQDWIQGQAQLENAVSFIIDGSVYVLNNDGTINKFYAGETDAFTNNTIEPKITDANKLIAGNDNLYIIEKATKRLIVLDKTGNLIKQLIFETLPEINDLTINNSTGYLISNNAIYSFSI